VIRLRCEFGEFDCDAYLSYRARCYHCGRCGCEKHLIYIRACIGKSVLFTQICKTCAKQISIYVNGEVIVKQGKEIWLLRLSKMNLVEAIVKDNKTKRPREEKCLFCKKKHSFLRSGMIEIFDNEKGWRHFFFSLCRT